jgi:hypothetical protein
VSFLFLARIAAVTAPDIISASSQRTAIFAQAISAHRHSQLMYP